MTLKITLRVLARFCFYLVFIGATVLTVHDISEGLRLGWPGDTWNWLISDVTLAWASLMMYNIDSIALRIWKFRVRRQQENFERRLDERENSRRTG